MFAWLVPILFASVSAQPSVSPGLCCACSRGTDMGSDLVSFSHADGQSCSSCCTQAPELLEKHYEVGKDEAVETCSARGHASADCSYIVTLPSVKAPIIKSPLANLAVTFQDCGDASTDAKVTDVEPKTLVPGTTTVISGSGHLAKDVTGGTYTMTMTGAGGLKLLDCSGDASQEQECDIKAPLIGKVGSLVYKPVTFPIKAGDISGTPQVATTLNAGLPSTLEATTTTLKVTGADGGKVICVEIFTKAAALEQNVIV